MNTCQDCGMACEPAEYHPMAACLMFKACHDGDLVRANLGAVAEEAVRQEREAIIAGIDDGASAYPANDWGAGYVQAIEDIAAAIRARG